MPSIFFIFRITKPFVLFIFCTNCCSSRSVGCVMTGWLVHLLSLLFYLLLIFFKCIFSTIFCSLNADFAILDELPLSAVSLAFLAIYLT